MNTIKFDIHLQAEKESETIVIPPSIYEKLMKKSADAANYTSQLMAARFSEVVSTFEKVLFKGVDKRIAVFLLEKAQLEGSLSLSLTHDTIARNLCTAREVVTRILKQLQDDNLLKMERGKVIILDGARLKARSV